MHAAPMSRRVVSSRQRSTRDHQLFSFDPQRAVVDHQFPPRAHSQQCTPALATMRGLIAALLGKAKQVRAQQRAEGRDIGIPRPS